MALSIQQDSVMMHKYVGLFRPLFITSTLMSMLVLSACQTAPPSVPASSGAAPSSTTVIQTPPNREIDNNVPESNVPQNNVPESNVPMNNIPNHRTPTTPPRTTQAYPSYPEPSKRQVMPNTNNSRGITNPITQPTQIIEPPEIIFNEPTVITPSRDDYMVSPPPTPSPRNALLERARRNSQQQSSQTATDQSDLPAFRNLIQIGIDQLRSNNLTAAESSFTRAQRLAPRSSAVYFYLSQVALKKNQPRKAEAMARRGLTVSQDRERRRALWQLILQSGQQQNNPRVIREAQQALR